MRAAEGALLLRQLMARSTARALQAQRGLAFSAAASDAPAAAGSGAAAPDGAQQQQQHQAFPGVDARSAPAGPHKLRFECGRLAQLAHGSCVARYGGTVVLSTVVVDPTPVPDADGTQLQVEFKERAYAYGRVPARGDRRDAVGTDREVLAARAVDRALRPLFPPGYNCTVQLFNLLLSSDGALDPEVLAINAASAALLRAGLPWGGPVGAVKVGLVGGELVVNPPPHEAALAELALTYAGAGGGRALMVEAAGDQVPDEQVAEALRFAAARVEPLLAPQLELASAALAARRRGAPPAPIPPKLLAAVKALALERSRELLGGGLISRSQDDLGAGKAARAAGIAELQADVLDGLRLQGLLPDGAGFVGSAAAPPAAGLGMFSEADALRTLDALQSRVLRDSVLSGGRRPDGRGVRELRRVAAAAGPLPRAVHGSALFDRGETQCLAAATVAPEREAVASDAAGGAPGAPGGGGAGAGAAAGDAPAPSAATLSANAETTGGGGSAAAAAPAPAAGGAAGRAAKRLLLHYSFLPFCTGEVGKAGAPGRREVGHGALAEKALAPLMPGSDDFPFWARVGAETLGSSGSSSMAAVCAGALALRAAGVPLRGMAAGVSVGLLVELAPQIQLAAPSGGGGGAQGAYEPGAGAGAGVDYGPSVLLTDIQGLEDHLGDMDFKVAGTRAGVTALQLDTKLPGLPVRLLCDALAPAAEARGALLDEMEAALQAYDARLPAGRRPQFGSVEIEKELVPRLIGLQGVNLLDIEAKTGAKLIVADSGEVFIYAPTRRQYEHAAEAVVEVEGRSIAEGSTYRVKVFKVSDYGAHVQLPNGMPALVHISQWAHHRVRDIHEVASEGMEVDVLCKGRDAKGQIILSRKALLPPPREHRHHHRPKPAAGGAAKAQEQPQEQEERQQEQRQQEPPA